MKPVRTVLAAGLVAGLSGCSNLHQSLMFRPATERATVARGEVDNAPPDLFYRPAETPTARLARYFPGLTRTVKPAKPTSEGTPPGEGNPELRAVPREAATDGEATTAAGRPRSYRSPTGRRMDVAMHREVPAERSETEPLPLLAAAVVAETDPSETPHGPSALPEMTPAQQALRAARVAEMSSTVKRSVRRMPPVPDVNPALAARSDAAPASRPRIRDEDNQARQVRARAEDEPAPSEAKPVAVAVAEPESRSLAPPVEDADPQPAAQPPVPNPHSRDVAAKLPVADDPPKAQPTPVDAPPSIESPAVEPAARVESRPTPVQTTRAVVDPDAGGDPTLAGRPRMVQVQPIRDHVPPDLPAVRFPRSYYSSGDLVRATPRPKVDPETRPARWTWTPKLLRRLRGEVAPEPTRSSG